MVPKIVHQIVGSSINESIQSCLDSWKCIQDQGFEIWIWNDATLELFLQGEYQYALPAFLNARNYAEAADIARYLLVYHFGGIYVDWDIELLNSEKFISLVESHKNGYLLIDPKNETIASEHFCSVPKDQYLNNLIGDIVNIYKSGERSKFTTVEFSGPFRMRDSLKTHKNTKMKIIKVKDVFAFDYEEIRSTSSFETTAPMIHYWMHSWLIPNTIS